MNQIILGSCKEVSKNFDYDYVFAVPPDFNELGIDPKNINAYKNFLKAVLIYDLKPRSNIVTIALTDRKANGCVIPKSVFVHGEMEKAGYDLKSHKILAKSLTSDMFRLTYSHVMTFGIGKIKQYKSQEFQPDVWVDGRERYKKFPYGMPVKTVERCIENYTQEGDIVYDPFMGSGTTAVAAKNLGRNYLGAEINEDYYNIAIERLKDE